MTRTLSAPVTVAFDYTRSTGPVLGRFLTGLRDGVVVGGRTSDGEVVVPPPEFDPVTHEPTTDFVEVAADRHGHLVDLGAASRSQGQPLRPAVRLRAGHPRRRRRAVLHALDVASPDEVSTGMRVQVRWAEERVGAITDIACFEPLADDGLEARALDAPSATAETTTPVTGVITPVALDYLYAASPEESAFYRGLAEGRILGQRCPTCQKVYVPPRSACPADGTPTTDEVELPDTGHGDDVLHRQRAVPRPEDHAAVRLGVRPARRRGHRVPAPDPRHPGRGGPDGHAGRGGLEAARGVGHHDREHQPLPPTGEPDADYETYKQHL